MAGEHEHSNDCDSQASAVTVSRDDIPAVGVEAPIRDSNKVDCWSLGSLYAAAASEEHESGNATAARVFGLLSAIANIHLKPGDQSEAYGPQFVMDGQRSMIPADLRGDQSTVIAELAPTIQNPGLRARLADIVWYNDRKLAAMAPLAIDAYCEAVQLVLDGKAEFSSDDVRASDKQGCEMLRRACQIARATGWKDPAVSRLSALIEAVIQDAVHRQDHRGFSNSAEIGLQFGIGNPASIAASAETFAASSQLDPHWSRDLWELTARAHHASKNHEDRDRCLVSAAESFVAIADAAGGEGMVAASALMDAIQALRRLRNTKERRQELEERLRHAQASVRDEMGAISTEIDLTEHVQHARRAVGEVSLAQALAAFARLTASPDPDVLREQAKQQAEENVLSALMPTTVVDEDGMVAARSPGHLGGDSDEDCALRLDIVRNEGLRRHIDVQGLIEPARQLIQSEHPIDQRDLRPIVEMTPFVPDDRVDLIATGFVRFFNGDFFSAFHILVPQLENTLRQALKIAGVGPSVIKSDMTQESRTLSILLSKDREALEGLLGSTIVFEIENLFDARGGPALRHQMAHGLFSSSECYDSESIYGCWFIFRLCCLPLFPHWDHVVQRLDMP